VNTVVRSAQFSEWLMKLRDINGRVRIVARVEAAEFGHFGDCVSIGAGVSEMRIHCGPGYRVYFTRRRGTVYFLLLGGDKSTQNRDIRMALKMARELED